MGYRELEGHHLKARQAPNKRLKSLVMLGDKVKHIVCEHKTVALSFTFVLPQQALHRYVTLIGMLSFYTRLAMHVLARVFLMISQVHDLMILNYRNWLVLALPCLLCQCMRG